MTEKGQLQLGALDREVVLQWRTQCNERNLKKIAVLRIMTHWWFTLDFETQKDLYFLPTVDLERFFAGFHDGTAAELRKAIQQYKGGPRKKKGAS